MLPEGTYQGINFRMRNAYISKAARDAAIERLERAYYLARNAYLDAPKGSASEERMARRTRNALLKLDREQERPYRVDERTG